MCHLADFQPTADPPALNIQDWLLACEKYHKGSVAVDNVTFMDEQKCYLVWNHLGQYGQLSVAHDPVVENHANDIWKDYKTCLIRILGTPVHETVAWKNLLDCQQNLNETVQEYVDRLHVLVMDIEIPKDFGPLHLLGIKLAQGIRDMETQKKLLALKKVDFDEFVKIAKADELVKASASIIRGQSTAKSGGVQNLSSSSCGNQHG